MPLFQWKDDYSVAVKTFDDQHKRLFDIINNLHDAMREGKSKEILSDTIKSLLDYTVTHFRDEENMMEKHGYSGLAHQQSEHKKFIDKIKQIQADYNSGKVALSMDIMNFLKDWLFNHIMGTDKKYSSFFKEKNVN